MRTCNEFGRYFCLRRTVILKEHLQPYICVVPSISQEVTWSDLVFSRVLCFLETRTCGRPFFQKYWINSQFQLQSSIRWMALFYSKVQLQNGDVMNTNFNTSLVSDLYALKKSVIWTHQFKPSIFSMVVSLFHGSSWSDRYLKVDTSLVAAIHYNKTSLVDSRKFEGYVYLSKAIVALIL